WVDDVPMQRATNQYTYTIKDAAGNIAVTNITVTTNNVTFTMSADGLFGSAAYWSHRMDVYGTITDSNLVVWVNGLQAAMTNGYWLATNVPVTPGGVAIFDLTAYPAG